MYTLARGSSVCLRCRLRGELRALALQQPMRTRQSTGSRTQTTAAASCNSTGNSAAETSSVRVAEGAEQSEEWLSNSETAGQAGHSAQPQRQQAPAFKERNWAPPATWRPLHMREESVELGVPALGKPARIRIVREQQAGVRREMEAAEREAEERGAARRRASEAAAADKNAFAAGFDENAFAAALAGTPADTGREAVNENIENLRRLFFGLRAADGFSRAQCAAVAAQLRDGVTYDQLAAYIADKAPSPRSSDPHDLEHWYAGRLVSRARWFAGVSPGFPDAAQRRIDDRSWALLRNDAAVSSLEPKKRKKLKYKELLVERVLRDIWGVRERDERARGELDFQIKNPVHMKLLVQHFRDVFRKRAEQFDVHINLDQARGLVRISGEYGMTSDAYKLILRDIRSIKTASIKVDSVPFDMQANDDPQPILANEAYQNHLEQLTRTKIVPRLRPEGKLSVLDHLDVYYLGSHRRALDDVQRLVAQTLQTKDPAKTQVLCDRMRGSATPTEQPIEPAGLLPIRDRYANWKRWSFSPNLDRETSLVKGASFVPDVVYKPYSARHMAHAAMEHLAQAWVDGAAPAEEAGSHWQAGHLCHLTATIGHLVHRADRKIGSRLHSAWQTTYETQQQQNAAVEETFASIIQQPRELLTGVPGLQQKLHVLTSHVAAVQNELRVTLRPHKVVSHDMATVGFLPDLELAFELDEGARTVRLRSVQLVRAWRESDLMLPTHGTDVRLVARSLIRAAGEVDPAVLRFVAESDLDVWGSGRLRTPAQLALDVPRAASLEWPADGPERVTAEYLFKSLEHRSRVPALYQGHRVYYSTVEAGRTGGRWDELKFEVDDAARVLTGGDDAAAGNQAFLEWFDGVREFNARLRWQ